MPTYDQHLANAAAELAAARRYASDAAATAASHDRERLVIAWEVRAALLGVALDALHRLPGLGMVIAADAGELAR
jgi:hypothetical protein